MKNRRAPLAGLSPRQRARWLTEVYPNPDIRENMAEQCENLMYRAAMRGQHEQARVWLGLVDVLLASLATVPANAPGVYGDRVSPTRKDKVR